MTIQINKQITIKTVPYLIILFLTFMILFGCTSVTINAANKLSYILLVIILTINQIFLYYNIHHFHNQYKIYMILSSVLMTFALLYIIYIKRIYDEEMEIIIELTNKDILEDTNVTC